MMILCLGTSFRTATIELRERLSLNPAEAQAALERFRAWRAVTLHPEAELAVVSTCNRLELYLAIQDENVDQAVGAVTGFMAAICDMPVESIEPCLYHFDQGEAVRHLCRVASGLDSMVLGESQILGQVSTAIQVALEHKVAGTTLSHLFHIAIRTGKRAQTETEIGRNPVSVGSVAVHRVEEVAGLEALMDARVLVVGAGMMAGLVIKSMRARSVKVITIANRTVARAAHLAEMWGAAARGLDDLPAQIAQADIVIAATGAAGHVITHEQVQWAMQMRAQQSLLLLDIALPRDIDPAVGHIPGVRLLNLDNLQSVVDASLSVRQLQVPHVLAIVDDGLREYEDWVRCGAVQPVISDLRQKAEAIRRCELERALRHLHDLDPETRDYIQGLTHSIVNKLLHDPTTRLRAAANDERAGAYADSLRYLFDLNSDAVSGASLTDG
jgi:glutamyl-tRNA reductase